MIQPALKDDAFLASVELGRQSSDEHLRFWWLGQSGLLVQWRRAHLLIDPYLSDSLTEKYASTDKPHVRMTERVVAPERLDFIDVVTSSHNHTDHLDAATLIPILRGNPGVRLIAPEANRAFVAERLNINPESLIGIDDGICVAVKDFEIHGIPAAHNTIERDSAGHCKFLGIIVKAGPWTIYHSGDTLYYEGLVEKLVPFHIDVAVLPINGNLPERRVAGNLDGNEAADLAKRIGARMAVPCHYDMFEFNTASPEIFAAACAKLDQRYRVLRAGECWSTLHDLK